MPATADSQPHLAWETSSSSTNRTVSDRLPPEVAACLENARFLHLATCNNNEPHVSLMNYTYLPPDARPPPQLQQGQQQTLELPRGPTIIMTSNPSSKKTLNLLQNPNVSLLVHDWVSTRPPNITSTGSGGAGRRERSPGGGRASSLANMLMQMNSAAVSSISATINGEARVLEPGTAEERWCREQHLLNNTFSGQEDTGGFGTSPADGRAGDGGRGSYIEDEEVRVVVVKIKDGRISDWKGGVKDWVIQDAGAESLVNGVDGNA
ncbi:hypothetical protein BDY17DRAFT_315007 [Neohortaea acidophila]|uniref:Pyridoxamine 5'-phosphate oxidase N-terminal domain-containing protein n=1 Tax=Neohortaea acidophila TaxID=245834 RepID=A0A6A6Q0L4_9PEZI|nr:uncharacterized protein BDY17DRAFT_315007 [Neohortaea acidophila]KAF2486018.1 hypothetical protein BDY17DRAFT_315007 [Neohortaea acidophila]